MSTENIRSFLEKARLDPGLLEMVSAVRPGPERPSELAKLSADAGVPADAAEWEAFLSKASRKLTDSELEALAGGGIFDFCSLKFQDQPK